MNRIFYFIVVVSLLAACRSNKDYLSRGDEDKALFDAVKKLNKKPTDEEAAKALPVLYSRIQQRYTDKINNWNNYKEPARWDGIVNAYSTLQRMYDAITTSKVAGDYVKPVNYQNNIFQSKQAAAEEYYQLGLGFLASSNRADSRRAYISFQKAGQWVNNYKDTHNKMNEAREAAIIDVVVNPLRDNAGFSNSGWGNNGYDNNNDYFQQKLVQDLGGTYASRYPARFYTDWEARRNNIQPHWAVDITLRSFDMPQQPMESRENIQRSAQIETGRDTSGNIIYKTVAATITVYTRSLTGRAYMESNVTDLENRKNIDRNTYNETYHWQEQYATWSGDDRALTEQDWRLINNQGAQYKTPTRGEIINQLYQRIYPNVRDRIANAVNW